MIERATFDIELKKNFLDYLLKIGMDYKKIEEQVSNYNLNFLGIKNNKIKDNNEFPSFMKTLCNYVYKHEKIPKQSTFWELYLANNKSHYTINNLNDKLLEALKS
jgi:catalase